MSKSNILSNRGNWQKLANNRGKKTESAFSKKLKELLPSHFTVINKPNKNIIYSNNKGVELDTLVINNNTNKGVYFEIKSGENGGNAHERACKFLTPIANVIKETVETTTNITLLDQPIWFGFTGKTFNNEVPYSNGKINVDPVKYRDEISIAFKNHKYFLLGNNTEKCDEVVKSLIEHLS
jgi:hypothetical protein